MILARAFGPIERLVDPYTPGNGQPASGVWAYLRQNFRPLRRAVILSLGLTIIAALIEVWLISYAGQIVDSLATATRGTIWATHGAELLAVAALLLIVRPISHGLREATNDLGLRPNAATLFRWRAHAHVTRQPVGWFQNDLSGRTANRIVEAGSAAAGAVYSLINAIAYVGIYLAGILVLMAAVDPRLTLPILVWLGLYAILMIVLIPPMERASERFQSARSALLGDLVDRFTNMDTVSIFTPMARIDRLARPVFENVRQRFFELQRLEVFLNILLTILEGFIIVGLVGYAILLWSWDAASLGVIAAALALSLKITSMMEWFMDAVWSVFVNTGELREALKTISQPIMVRDSADAVRLDLTQGRIEVRSLVHHYGRGAGALDGIDLTVAPGEKIGLVGRSGAGKSTLVNLLLRFHEAEGGKILIDGQDIRSVTLDSLRAAVGMVTQQAALLNRSVFENIAMARPDATRQEVEAAARRAEAHAFITDLCDPDGQTGYAARVGERGVKLSGGQRQRIAIARVILKGAPILILDEATSALDSEIEAAIQDTLYGVMEGKTVIAIAHRLSTIARMDRIVVLDDGKLAEAGTHDALLARGGIYAGLWAHQSGGFLGIEAAEQNWGQKGDLALC